VATYGSTPVDGFLNGNLQFLNQGFGLTAYPDYGGVDGDPVDGNAFIFLVRFGGSSGPIWLDTDLNKATGYNGYDYHVVWSDSGPPKLYSGSFEQTLVATLTDYVYVANGQYPTPVPALEFAIPSSLVGGATSAFATLGSGTSYLALPQAPGVAEGTFGAVTIDGNLGEWTAAQRIDAAAPIPGMEVSGRIAGGAMIFALHLDTGDFNSGNYTTLWLDTDFNRATGYGVPISNVSGAPLVQVGAEYNLRFDTAGHVILEKGNTLWPAYSPNGAAVYSETVGPVPYAYSADYKSVEVAVPLSMLGPNVTGAKVHVDSSYGGGPVLTADGYTIGTPPGGGGQPPPPAVTVALLHDSGSSGADRITSDPGLTGTGNAAATVRLAIDGAASASTVTADASGHWSFSPGGLSQGSHTIVASETDALGQTGSATLTFTYDSVAPTVAIGSSGGSTGSAGQTITGTGEAGSQVALFDGAAALGNPVQVAPNGSWSVAVSLSGSGNHVVTARDTDLAGNVGQSDPVTFTLAAKPPTFTGMTATRYGAVSLTGTGDANGRVTISDGTVQLGTANVNGHGRWSFITRNGLSNTTHVFTATSATGSPGEPFGSAQLGSSGADTLSSTPGTDFMTGGKGADLFSFMANFGGDVITDFVPGGASHDVISFKGNSVLNSYDSVRAHATQVGSNVVIRQDANNVLTLSNVSKSSLTASDFTFA